MAEQALQLNKAEAARLYERGVAAARGGQRRIAVSMLSRAVQCDPQHEQAWLWLSGVLDEPGQIAFCLRSVLALNPTNERAKRGLEWLERQHGSAPAPTPVTAGGAVIATPALTLANASATSAPVRRGDNADATLLRGLITTPRTDTPDAGLLRRLITTRTPATRDTNVDTGLLRRLITTRPPEPTPISRDTWWVVWRNSRREMTRARVLFWLVPVLLLTLTLGFNAALRDTVERNAEAARIALQPPPTAVPAEGPLPTAVPAAILRDTITPAEQAQALAYFSTLTPQRETLNSAIAAYKEATSRPGNASGVHAAAARKLRSEIEAGYTSISALTPPAALTEAHASYLEGLQLELAALDDILEFYGSFSVQLANRATLRMDTAARRMELARVAFSQYLDRTGLSRPWEAHTVR